MEFIHLLRMAQFGVKLANYCCYGVNDKLAVLKRDKRVQHTMLKKMTSPDKRQCVSFKINLDKLNYQFAIGLWL